MAKPADFQAKALDRFGDWRWRLNNLYWITNEEGRRVKFEMNWAQEALFEDMHYLNTILKARQLGITTFLQLFMLDACLFNSNIRAGTIAHTLTDATIIFRDKVKYPYDNLPDGLRQAVPLIKDSANELILANNSSLRVGTSLRSGTLQYLHVSEYGKICARYPEKALEIQTGALNTLAAGQMVFIESTAEGQGGSFYEMCETAESKQRTGAPLTSLDFKFFFFPWWMEDSYELDPEGVVISDEFASYFDKLETEEGIVLSAEQKAWYVKKAETQQGHMKREYPATSKEAFEAAILGAYYADELAKVELEGRIGKVPYEPALPVETWWDLGRNDKTAIWFVQRHHRELRMIDYEEDSGESIQHYLRLLQKKPYVYGRHLGPHDMAVTEYSNAENKSRAQVAADLGFKFEVVERTRDINEGIDAVRRILPRCWFDEAKCDAGLRALREYRKEWDENLATWKNRPRHDFASDGADAFRTGAQADEKQEIDLKKLDPLSGRGGSNAWMGA